VLSGSGTDCLEQMAAGEKQKISLVKLLRIYKLRLNFTVKGKTANEVMYVQHDPIEKLFLNCVIIQ